METEEMALAERMMLRQLQAEVQAETVHARKKLPAPRDVESLPAVYGLNATVEEVGKLARCYNKLVIAEIPEVRAQWRNEARHRMVTCLSLLERLYIKLQREANDA